MTANFLLRRLAVVLFGSACIALVCLGFLIHRSRQASREATTSLQTTVARQQPIIDQATRRERQRDAAVGKHLAHLAHIQRETTTPAQIIRELPTALPPLPQPVSIAVAAASSEATPPVIVTVPSADLSPLLSGLEDCRACTAKLAAVQQDLADERAKVSALTAERDAAMKAARGGGFWSRVRGNAKWFAVGAALGALAASAHR